MRNMKKVLAVAMVAATVLSGCGGKATQSPSQTTKGKQNDDVTL